MGTAASDDYLKAHDLFLDSHQGLPVLNIGDRSGFTGYIDFIKPNECVYPAMKGLDNCNRSFIVVKGNVTLKDDSIVPFSQTFFQRYSPPDNLLWMGAYCGGKELFETVGGLNIHQRDFLRLLLTDKSIEWNSYMQEHCRLQSEWIDVKRISLG
jgi:hypothetical protein